MPRQDIIREVILEKQPTKEFVKVDEVAALAVFLAGDAAHLWPPFAGHGMNTGIEDGVAITWMLAAVLQGWAPPALLDAYEAERHNVGEKVSRAAEGLAARQGAIWKSIDDVSLLDEDSEAGEQLRKRVRDELVMTIP